MRWILSAAVLVACLPAALAADTSTSLDASFAAQEPTLSGPCGCCDECYDCCDMFNCRKRFLGLLPSDHCFDDFISPNSNPFFFEDPRSLTEVRGIFLENSLPSDITGGDFQLYSAQLRGRVTDRWSIIAPRLGVLQVNQAGNGAPNGFLSAPVGFKYNFLRDPERQLIASCGLTYFIKGSGGAMSNFGDGDYHLFLSGGAQIFDRGHWVSGTGFRLPGDRNWGTQLWYWSNQWDYQIRDGLYLLSGVNWFHWMSNAGVNTGIPVTGLDIINIPVHGAAGDDVVTGVVGVKLKPSRHMEIGTGFEFPLTNRNDILRNRLYVDLIFRY